MLQCFYTVVKKFTGGGRLILLTAFFYNLTYQNCRYQTHCPCWVKHTYTSSYHFVYGCWILIMTGIWIAHLTSKWIPHIYMLRLHRFHVISLTFIRVQTISSPTLVGWGISNSLESYSLWDSRWTFIYILIYAWLLVIQSSVIYSTNDILQCWILNIE